MSFPDKKAYFAFFAFTAVSIFKLTFVAEKPPPSQVLTEVALMAAEQQMECFL